MTTKKQYDYLNRLLAISPVFGPDTGISISGLTALPSPSRGNGEAAVFHNDVDRRSFVQTLVEASAKTDWQVHAYRLMKTHFHLVVETPRANLVSGMKWLLSTYTIRFKPDLSLLVRIWLR